MVFFISCSSDDGDERSFEQFSGDQVRLTIEIIPAGSGVVNPHSGLYSKGQFVTLQPDSNSGYSFSHWTGDIVSNYHSQTIKMDSDKTITAVFIEYHNDFLDPKE
jgi:hypothetical protein